MSVLKVEVEAKITPTASVEQPIPVLANNIPIGGEKGQVLTKKSGKPYDVAWENPKGGEGGGEIVVEGVTEERVEEIVSEKNQGLQPKVDESLETESKEIVAAINEVNKKVGEGEPIASFPEIEYYTLTNVSGEETPATYSLTRGTEETLVDVELTFVDNMIAQFIGMSVAVSPYAVQGSAYAVIDVVAGERYYIDNVMSFYQARGYVFTDSADMPVEVYPTTADTTKKWYHDLEVTVPDGATKLYLSSSGAHDRAILKKYTSSSGDNTDPEEPDLPDVPDEPDEPDIPEVGGKYKYVLDIESLKTALGVSSLPSEPTTKSGAVVAVKKGTSIQVRTPLRGIDGVMCVNMTTNGSNNASFNFSSYTYGSKPSEDNTIVTGTSYKGATDDICPIKYNGSYMAGNHGNICGCKVVSNGHGKTESDIGSLWTSASKTFILLSIIDNNTLLMSSDYSGNPSAPLDIMATPSGTLVHYSGATNTATITVSSASRYQICPAINNIELSIISDSREELKNDGYIYGEYVDIVETYQVIDIPTMLLTLKANVGKNKNNSYYADSLIGEVLYETIYRFFPSGCCLVISSVIPLREGIKITIFGGTQSQMIGNTAYVPYTNFDTLTTIESSGIILTPDTWKDTAFPPYKFYEFNTDGDKAFAVGYCLYGQTDANSRMVTAERAGWFDGSTKKIYPCIIFTDSSADMYGKGITSYSWRTPIIKDENGLMMTWYKVGNDTFVEMEFFSDFSGKISMPEHLSGCRMEVIKKTDSVNVLGDIVGASGINVIVNGGGSATIKCL